MAAEQAVTLGSEITYWCLQHNFSVLLHRHAEAQENDAFCASLESTVPGLQSIP